MEKKKTDRRIRKTEAQLRKGLLELLKEKNIQNITVQELVDKVDMNRSTFYLHYKDIYDLLEHIENNYFDDFRAFMDSHKVITDIKKLNEDKITDTMIDYFKFLKKNEDLVTVLIGYNGDLSFSKRQVETLTETIYGWLYDDLGIVKNQQNDDIFQFCTYGSIGLVRNWVMNGYKEPPESIGKLTSSIIISNVKKFLIK